MINFCGAPGHLRGGLGNGRNEDYDDDDFFFGDDDDDDYDFWLR